MRTGTQQELIDIIRFEIRGIPLPDGFTVSDEEALVDIAKKHDLTHLVYDALTKNGLPCKSQFAMQQYYASIWRAEQMAHELSSMAELFESEGIDFMPLKGSVMRSLYPEPWMRTSADIDILFREKEAPQACSLAAEKLGYTFGPRDISYHHRIASAPISNVQIEMHHLLYTDNYLGETARSVLDGVWDNGPREGRAHWYEMSDSMFYYYHILHMAKHFSESGNCPVRGIMDLWILDHLPDHDESGRKQLLQKGGLSAFAEKVSDLGRMWLEDLAPADDRLYDLEQYVLTDGMYGSVERRITSGLEEQGRFRYILKRLILPYDTIKYSYPVLQKHKWLTPVCQIARWTWVFRKDYREQLKSQSAALIKTSAEDKTQSKMIKEYLGIKNI